MKVYQIVIDTNVLISALRSQYGASYKLLMLLGGYQFEINLSVPLALEYEDVSQRMAPSLGLTNQDITEIIDYIIAVSNRHQIHYLWRPFLRDPKDDMVLEIAVSSGSDIIVTYNKSDFIGAEQFGIELLTAQEFLQRIGVFK